MTTPPVTTPAELLLDDLLGHEDAWDAEAAARDAAEEFPAALHERLDAFGLQAHYVPPEWGGALDNHEQLLRLWRTVARRDLSAAVAHGKTYLGTAPVWLAGDAGQAARTAAEVLAGTPVAWALSEPDHGADLLHGATTATAREGGYRLDGFKWPINNATRARYVTVLARTGTAGDARGQSLFLVDKRALPPGSWRPSAKVATHGIRGVDISGIIFEGADVDRSALLGAAGTGLETVLRSLQLTRTMCAALSLGAGDRALRSTARFVATRIIQRRPLLDRAHPAGALARCAALLAAAEAVALAGTRSVHSLTDEMSVTSAIVKAHVPTVVNSMLRELAELLGARSFLRDEYEHGMFPKLVRDHQVVAIFDGSTPVNRTALVHQFPRLASGFAAGTVTSDGLADVAAVGGPLPPLDRRRLTLVSRRGCSVVQALPALAAAASVRRGPPGLAEHAAALVAEVREVCRRLGELGPAARPSMVGHELAAAYEWCYAGAACLLLWTAGESTHAGEPLWRDGLWIRAALREVRARLARVLRSRGPDAIPGDDELDRRLADEIANAARTGAPVTPFGTPIRRGTERDG